jgi:hypothetical protein
MTLHPRAQTQVGSGLGLKRPERRRYRSRLSFCRWINEESCPLGMRQSILRPPSKPGHPRIRRGKRIFRLDQYGGGGRRYQARRWGGSAIEGLLGVHGLLGLVAGRVCQPAAVHFDGLGECRPRTSRASNRRRTRSRSKWIPASAGMTSKEARCQWLCLATGGGSCLPPPASRLPPLPLLPKTENRKPKTENQTQSTYASRFLPRITRCFSIFQSRSFRVARLSCSCLPLASASSSLTLLAFQYIAVGTRV